MEPADDVEDIWNQLQSGIEEAYVQRQMGSERYMLLYGHVYGFCSKGAVQITIEEEDREAWKQRRLTSGHRNVEAPSVYAQGFIGNDLYNRIQKRIQSYLAAMVESAKEKTDESLVKFYLEQWEWFTFSSKVVNGFCAYLNQHWIAREKRDHENEIMEILPLAVEHWKGSFFEPLREQIVGFILNLIKRNRQGESVNLNLIKAILESLVELGSDPDDPGADELTMYQRKFEDDFIKETVDFYNLESNRIQAIGNVSEYMKTVENYILEEQKRVKACLHATTMERLMKTVENVLIVKKIPAFQDEFPKLLKIDDTEGIGRMYQLIHRIPKSFGTMMNKFHEHVALAGRAALKENRELCLKAPVEYTKTVLGVYKKYLGIVNGPLQKNSDFLAALDKGCADYINQNDLTNEPSTSHRSPNSLGRYVDSLLKKSGKVSTDEELEELLNEAIAIFKYIEDKDVFQQRYSQLLAKRLIDELSTSDEAESSMINKLKIACGYEYTTKLHNMFKDIRVSRDRTGEFKDWMCNQPKLPKLKLDFSAKILTTGSWPYGVETNPDFQLPTELGACVTNFEAFYKSKTQGRKLRWMHGKSKGEVTTGKAVFLKDTSYTFILPTYGVALLLLFNARKPYTLEELCKQTTLKEEAVVPIIQVCMKATLLKCDVEADALASNSVIQVNKSFKSSKRKINLAVNFKADMKGDDDRNRTKVEEERKFEVQATIVRVMKARKLLKVQLIISEVVGQMQGRFNPSPELIKKSINTLIEKEYLRPNEKDASQLEYIS